MTEAPAQLARRKPAVSVVMPCFNAMETIEASIASVQTQSMDDWELIVVDDGSSDTSLELVRDIASADRRVRVVAQRNSGPAVARNSGVRLATADVVAFLDSDDVWGPNHLAVHYAQILADPQLGISYSPSLYMNARGEPTGEGNRVPRRALAVTDLLAGNPTGTCSALVARRGVFDTAGFMRDDMVHAEDQEWLIRVLHAGWRIACAPDAPIRYRISGTGLSSNVEKMLAGWQTVMLHARTRYPDVVATHEAPAFARMQLYFARHAVRSSRNRRAGFRHIATAVARHPALLLEAPTAVLGTVAVCALPGISKTLRSAIPGGSHA